MFLPRSEQVQELAARYIYNNRNCSYNNRSSYCNSAWSRWGRWVLAGILIFIALVVIFFFACLRQRRRRRAHNFQPTQAPMAAPVGGNAGYYNNQPQPYNEAYAPPAGAPPPNYGGGYDTGNNTGYYGQQNGVAQPQTAYVK